MKSKFNSHLFPTSVIYDNVLIVNILYKSVSIELTPIGNFVVQVCHDTKTHPHLLVCLGVVRAHLGPPICKRTSSHLWEKATAQCHVLGLCNDTTSINNHLRRGMTGTSGDLAQSAMNLCAEKDHTKLHSHFYQFTD